MGTEVNEVPTWHGELRVQVVDPRTETPDAPSAPGVAPAPSRRGETYVSYGIRAETTLAHFSHQKMETRKRFQDFCFLHDALTKEFPASIVPPLPDKRRIGYLIGDRFSDAFIQRRVSELQLFLERICRHPILQRATILQQFLASSEWVRIRTLTQHIDMHTHSGRPVASGDEDVSVTPTVPHGLLEQMSDTVLNAFTKVRKPDPRFRAMMAELDQNEETNGLLRRVLLRNRTHISGRSHRLCTSRMTYACVKWLPLTNCTQIHLAHRLKIWPRTMLILLPHWTNWPCSKLGCLLR